MGKKKPKIIIGIHGLGNKPSKTVLEEWWMESIREGLKGIGKDVDIPPFKMIYWADVFNQKPLDHTITDIDDVYYLDEKYTPTPMNYIPEENPLRRRIMGFIERHMDRFLINADLSLKFPNISDVVINRYFYEVGLYFNNNGIGNREENIEFRKKIRQRIAEGIEKYRGYDIFLVAHSMGSIVAYDVLSLDIADVEISTFATIGSPLGIPVILSKITNHSEYRKLGHLKPQTPPGVKCWINFSDPEDRIAFDHTLNDDFAENHCGVRAKDISVHNNFISNGMRNPHKSFGYLRAREFSEMLSEFIGERKPQRAPKFLRKVRRTMRKWLRKKKH